MTKPNFIPLINYTKYSETEMLNRSRYSVCLQNDKLLTLRYRFFMIEYISPAFCRSIGVIRIARQTFDRVL